MTGQQNEIAICGKHCEFMPDAKLPKQRIDGTDLNTAPPAAIAQFRRFHVVPSIRHDQRQC